jgi:hypothetical protein
MNLPASLEHLHQGHVPMFESCRSRRVVALDEAATVLGIVITAPVSVVIAAEVLVCSSARAMPIVSQFST